MLLLLFHHQVCYSQLEQYNWSSVKNLTTADGLPSNFTDVLLQDSHGFVWFVTNNGVVRYDGITMKKYLPEIDDANSFSPDWFSDMIEDKEGNLWIAGNNAGLYQLNPVTDKIIHYRHQPNNSNSLPDDQITSIKMDSSGKIWISSFGGLNCYNKTKNVFTSFFHNDKDSTSISHNQIDNGWVRNMLYYFICFCIETIKSYRCCQP